MTSNLTQDQTDRFVVSLLSAGATLQDLAANLVDALSPDAFEGEDHDVVVIQMLAGTIRSAIENDPPHVAECAISMIERAVDRVIEHLEMALALRRRMESGIRGQG
jgi:hypothetical protein